MVGKLPLTLKSGVEVLPHLFQYPEAKVQQLLNLSLLIIANLLFLELVLCKNGENQYGECTKLRYSNRAVT